MNYNRVAGAMMNDPDTSTDYSLFSFIIHHRSGDPVIIPSSYIHYDSTPLTYPHPPFGIGLAVRAAGAQANPAR